jgi:hypothetical protein
MLLLNLFQTWQWAHGIIDRTRMTKAYYFATFGKTSFTEADRKLLLIERPTDAVDAFQNESDYKKSDAAYFDFEKTPEGDMMLSTDTVFAGKSSLRMDSQRPFSTAFEMPFSELTSKDHAWIRAEVRVFPTVVAENTASLVITFQHKGENYNYRSLSISAGELKMKSNEWNLMKMDYLTPEVRSKDDHIKAYFWVEGTAPVFIDDMKFMVYEPE